MNPALALALGLVNEKLNKVLALDPEAGQKMAGLEGRSLTLTLTRPNLSLRADFGPGQIFLALEDTPSDVRLSGSASELLAAARQLSQGGALVFDGLKVEGSVGTLKAISDAASALNIDFEHELSKRLGDPISSAIVSAAKGFVKATAQSASDTGAQVKAFVAHEQQSLLAKPEFAEHKDALRQLRQRIERFERNLAGREK